MTMCGACRFWFGQSGRHGAVIGQCLRHAPVPTERPDAQAHWPVTRVTDGCGEGLPLSPVEHEEG